MAKISIIVPVYYNEQSLAPLFSELTRIEKTLIEKGLQMELIFVDDGSRDGSVNELLKIKSQKEDVKIIKLTRNFGAVQASKTGFRFVTGDCFLILAADLQDPPELILQTVEKWLKGAKFVTCVRAKRADPLGTRIAAFIYYELLKLFAIKDYPRGGYDVALMDRSLLPFMQNCGKNINTPLFAYWLGFKPETITYERRRRTYGNSRWTFSKRVKFFIDSILGFSVIPIRLISLLGLLVSIVSFAYGVVIVVSALRGTIVVQGFPTLAALISFLLGVVLLTLGIIGEYVWRIFDEINRSPETVIEEIL